jgi:hypothetical protein
MVDMDRIVEVPAQQRREFRLQNMLQNRQLSLAFGFE